MALTTHQINQAYVSVLGRAAIGTEIAKAAEAESVNALAASLITEQQTLAKAGKAELADVTQFGTLESEVIENSKGVSSAEFVENLYTTFLNRGSDEEGLAYWKGVLANGATKEEVVAAFKAAIIAQAAEGTEDYVNYQAQVAAKADAFLENLYQTDLGRAADEEGKAYWAGEIAKGASYAQIIEAFTAATEAQGTKTEDGQTFANKLAIADYATEKLQAFSKTATAANIKEANEAIKAEIAAASFDTNEEGIAATKENIDNIANTYKAQGTKSFTTSPDDKLGVDDNGVYNTTAATNFQGTVNLDDQAKGTIQNTDYAYGNPTFAKGNILTVNVAGTTNTKTLDLDLNLLPQANDITNLAIKASSAKVTGTINTNFTNVVTVEAGLSTADTPLASDITIAHTVDTYKAGSKADSLTINAGAVKNIDMGAGNDTITLSAANTAENIVGGAGKDALVLAAVAASPAYGIKSISGIEEIQISGATNATSGATISYDVIKANPIFNLTNDANDASGNLTIDAGTNTSIDVSKIVNGKIVDGVYANQVASLTISGVKKGDTITLDNSATNNLKDIIKLTDDNLQGGNFTVKNFSNTAGTDSIAFTNAAEVGGAEDMTDLTAPVGEIAKVSITVSGVATFYRANDTEITINDNNIRNAAAALNDATALDTAITGDNHVIAINGTNAYLVNIQTADSAADDIIVKLVGLTINNGIDVSNNAVTLA